MNDSDHVKEETIPVVEIETPELILPEDQEVVSLKSFQSKAARKHKLYFAGYLTSIALTVGALCWYNLAVGIATFGVWASYVCYVNMAVTGNASQKLKFILMNNEQVDADTVDKKTKKGDGGYI